jgi:hypothetical protein
VKVLICWLAFLNVHVLWTQEFVIPPEIDLFQYNDPARHQNYSFQSARIWGWSRDGKVAYSIEGYEHDEAGYDSKLLIFDLITDSVLYTLYLDSYHHNLEGDALYHVYRYSIENAMRAYAIADIRTGFLPFPFRRNNLAYNASVIDIKYGMYDDNGDDINIMQSYKVLVTADTRRKIIGTFTPKPGTHRVHICGYFLSPFENRALVVAAEEWRWFRGSAGLRYLFSGCHLGAGFE